MGCGVPEKHGPGQARRTQSGHSGTADRKPDRLHILFNRHLVACYGINARSTRDALDRQKAAIERRKSISPFGAEGGERISAANACSTMLHRTGTQNAEKQAQRDRELLMQQQATDISSRGHRHSKRPPAAGAPPSNL